MHLATLISDLALLLVVAGITTLLCKKLNQPTVIGYILAGFLIGPVVKFVPTVGDMENINLWAEIGIIFLMFSLGLEFSLDKLAKVGSTGIIAALVQVAGMTILGYGAGMALGWSHMNSIFLGGMLGMSSTMITIKAIEDLGYKEEKFTKISIGILVIEDIVAIFMMVILSTLAVSQGISGIELASTISRLMFYLVLWLLAGIYLLPTFLKKTTEWMNPETLLVVSLGICFGMVWLADAIGFSSALGAFMAGSILAGTIHGERIAHLVNPCKDLFGAVFFVSVGLKVIPEMLIEYWFPILMLTLVTIIAKAILLTGGMLAAGEDLRTSLYGAFSQTQIGEFSFIIATLGISLGVTSDFLYPVIVAVSVVTTFTTPYMIRSADKAHALIQHSFPKKWLQAMNRYKDEHEVQDGKRDPDWKLFLKGYITTFALYSVIVLGIAEAGHLFLLPFLSGFISSEMAAKVITCIVIYSLMAPFLPALMVFRRRYFTALWLKRYANHFPLMLLVGLRTAVTILLVMRPLSAMFDLPMFMVLFIVAPAVLFLSRSNWLIGRYLEIEARFISNFNERKLQEEKQGNESHSWLDEQLCVEAFRCQKGSNAAGKKLLEMQWGKILQVNVIKIIRGKKHINIPEGFESLQEGDKVFILASDKALDNFLLMNEKQGYLEKIEGTRQSLRNFVANQDQYSDDQQLFCSAVKVKKGSSLIGSSIRDSKIKSDWSCCLIGIERELLPISNISPNLVINAGDLLWVLGSHKMGETLVKNELI